MFTVLRGNEPRYRLQYLIKKGDVVEKGYVRS